MSKRDCSCIAHADRRAVCRCVCKKHRSLQKWRGPGFCLWDNKKIVMQIQKNTDYCCGKCMKNYTRTSKDPSRGRPGVMS